MNTNSMSFQDIRRHLRMSETFSMLPGGKINSRLIHFLKQIFLDPLF